MLGRVGQSLAAYLSAPRPRLERPSTTAPGLLARALRPADVLLIEGSSRISAAIKYLTQSTWSHAALYIGEAAGIQTRNGEAGVFIESDINEGVRAVSLTEYENLHTRVCRPVGLTRDEVQRVVSFAVERIGHRYDLKHIFDLARYLVQRPPVPDRWKRRLIALGSGDPTRAICSSLIARAFQSVRYPILPEFIGFGPEDPACRECNREILHIRHHSLFVPRDFDISPYFEIVKPNITTAFDFHRLRWTDEDEAERGLRPFSAPPAAPEEIGSVEF